MIETHPSICRFCIAHCPILVTVEDGRPTKVVGDPKAPLYHGYSCPKGRALPEQHNHPDRLLHTLKRNAKGEREPIDPERAMDEIAAKISALVEQYGPRSVALYVGTNSLPYPASPGMANAWLRGIGSPMFFTSNTIDQPGKQIASALHGGWQAGEHAFDSADSWLLLGLNPLISKSAGVPSQNPGRKLKEAVDAGLKLVVVDPRRTETARRATLHLQPHPGEDPTILAGLIRVVLDEALHDEDFIAANAEGMAELEAAVEFFTPDYVAKRAGIDADDLVAAARIFAAGPRGVAISGTGPNFATHGNLSEYLTLCLNTLCGRWNREGDPMIRPNVMMPAYTAKAQPYKPYRAWGYGEQMRVRGLGNTTSGMPTAALADEILLEGEGQVKTLICLGGNPMMAWPNQEKTHRAMQELELLVTLDVELSATSQMADYAIGTRLTLETPGMTQPAEALKFFGPTLGFATPYAQYSERVVAPPEGAEVIEEWEFFYGLAQRMNLPLSLVGFYGWGRHIESPMIFTSLDMENKPTTEEIYEILCKGSRVPLSEVKRHPHAHVFNEHEAMYVQPRDADNEDRLMIGHEHMLRELADVLAEDWATRQNTDEYPYRLIPRRANNFVNSAGRSLASLRGKTPYNPAFLNPADLAELGLSSGQSVEIRSPHGAILGIVEPDKGLRRGCLSMTHAFGELPDAAPQPEQSGANTGRLTSDEIDYDAVTGMPRLGAIPVHISALAAVSATVSAEERIEA
jgi:anaerobic selenocysteine-containing dehydrogenase